MRGKKRPTAQRLQAVGIAVVDGLQAASDKTGIPPTTIKVWMDRPEFADLRTKTREELADGFKALAHLAMTRLLEQAKAGNIEPRDLTILLGVATDKHLLMSGQATSRSETKDITLDDHESEVLGAVVRNELARRADEHAAEPAVESAEATGAETPAG